MDCKNCNTILKDTDDFCNACGAKVIRNRLTVSNLFAHFSEQFLNYDNKFFQTFIQLFTKPEAVIGSYINGTRKKYVNVISYFAIAITVSGLQMYILNKFFPEALDIAFSGTGTNEATAALQQKNMQFVQEYQSIIMMLFVPIYALMARIVFFDNKKFNYTELLVIFMYILSQMTIVGAVIMIISANFGETIAGVGAMISIPLQIIYSAYCLKRLFKISVKKIIFRTLFFLLVLCVFFILFSILSAVLMFLTGDMQEVMEAQKAAREASGT
ncbi:DUF3667 domain-containing protein [Lacinutrix iliipiscaria]|uniref:DUF3667 domain-containing protein n=1 Tax=Lacinutrix iliipiscaria TaxID=1230532 RepID=A0ABW5WMP7_9FLAO